VGYIMSSDTRGLLQILKSELEFLEKGGYRNPSHASWRPQFIFQDSPTCLNFENPTHPRPCSECVLMQFVPSERRGEKVPCRHIPLNEQRETIDSFYRSGTQQELETAVAQWLRSTIQSLEREQAQHLSLPSEAEGMAKRKSANE
jgi:hypothetical protein